ncbi:MAG: tetratricopeptide repeat protein [Gemmatimonadota bacterium]
MSQVRRFVICVLCLSVASCASGGLSVSPENIPALEQRAATNPNDAEAATSLGVAYYNAQRFEDARNTLTRALATGSAPEAAHLYLGLANEELKDWAAARAAYEQYVNAGETGEVKDRVRARLVLIARQQLRQDARLVLEREQQMSDEPPTERTIAVMPFNLVGFSEELAPLRTALSDMIITDLSISPAVTSVERVKINAMIDEMLLAQAGLAEKSTGARVGRLLKAEHVVQGVLAQSGEEQVRMDANVLNTVSRENAGTFGQDQQLTQIFDLEKQIVFSIFDAIGVTLTPAERERINENRTANLLAFLAYGRGLEAADAGNYQQAQMFFRQAAQLDPGFQAVRVQEQQAAELQQAEQVSTTEIAAQGSAQIAAPAAATDLLRSVRNETTPSPVTTTTEQAPATQGTAQQQNQSGNLTNSQGGSSGIQSAAKATVRLNICNPSRGQC